jgi:hypothetical protein
VPLGVSGADLLAVPGDLMADALDSHVPRDNPNHSMCFRGQ